MLDQESLPTVSRDDCWADSLQLEVGGRIRSGEHVGRVCSGELLDCVALPDRAARNNFAKHSAAASDFFTQAGTQAFHLTAGSTRHGHFE